MSVFKLTVQYQTSDGYPVVAEFSQTDRFPVRAERRLRLDEDTLLDLQTCGDSNTYGRILGQTLLQGAIWESFVRARAASADRMHLLLCIEPTELRVLSWERLQVPVGDERWDFLALDQSVPFSLYMPSSTDRRFLPFGPRDLRALIVTASPNRLAEYGLSPFSALEAAMRLGSVLSPIPYCLLAQDPHAPFRLGPPTLDCLCEVLTQHRFTLLHIFCHGQLRADGETVLFLADQEGSVKPVTATQLITRLSRLGGSHGLPHLTFLAACETAHPSAEVALGGLGQRLVRELGMPAVIAMTAKVSVDLATELSSRFYPRLRAHGAVDVALVEANAGLAEHADVLVPALYSRLGERPLWSERDDGRALTRAEIEHGLQRIVPLIAERAPALAPELAQTTDDTQRALHRPSSEVTGEWLSPPELAMRLHQLEVLCSEAVECTFRHLALGRAVPAYDSRCPFRGLHSFGVNDGAFFFGRDELVSSMLQKLLAHRFLAVLGPSGTGKSSVVLAGLVPELRRRCPAIQVLCLTPGKEPLTRLEHALTAAGKPTTERENEVAALCLVNQFEEVFTLCTEPEQRRAFFERLLALVPKYAVVITMRADFWGECADHHSLKEWMLKHQELVGPMTGTELRRAIEQQVSAVGLRFEDGLCATMLSAIEEEPGGMPLLQHTLLELWKRRRGSWLRAQEYRNLGGVQLAIAETAEAVYQQIAAYPEQQQRMREIFTRLTHLDTTASAHQRPRDTRRSVAFTELIPAGTDQSATHLMIARLADARLIVTRVDAVSGQLEAEVAHEAVIRYWPRLRTWLDEDRIAIAFREGVRHAAKEWLSASRSDNLLLHRGERLQLVAELRRTTRHLFNQLEQEYLDACFAAQEEERRQKEAQQQREIQYAKDLALALERALTAARNAQSRQLAMHAAVVYPQAPMLALLLTQQAMCLYPTAEAMSMLQTIFSGPLESAILTGHAAAVIASSYAPDDSLLLTASMDKTARIWSRSGQCMAVLSGHTDAVLDAAWSPDGQHILTTSSDRTARMWTRNGSAVAVLVGHHGPVLGGAFSPDGESILTYSSDHTARLWSHRGEVLNLLRGHEDALTSAHFSRSGERILSTSKDRTARVWSRHGLPIQVLRGHAAAVSCGSIHPSGQQFVTVSWDHSARLWSESGTCTAVLSGHTDRVNFGEFSPDGKLILTASRDHTARLWDDQGKPLGVLRGHDKGVQGARFSPDGSRIVTFSSDHTARLWERDGRALCVLRGHDQGVQSGSFTSSSSDFDLATTSWDGTTRVWSGSGSCSLILRGHQSPLTQCALSPNGQLLLTAAQDNTVYLWRVEGQRYADLTGHSDAICCALFMPDGRGVLTLCRDGTATLWSQSGAKHSTLLPLQDLVVSGALSTCGRWLATASIDGSAMICGRDGRPRAVLKHSDAALTGCCFSPTQDLVLVTGSDGVAVLWESSGGKRAVLRSHQDVISSGCFSPDGQLLLTTSWDGSAYLCSADTTQGRRLEGHSGALLGGCFNRDGSRILTYSRDHSARLYNKEGQLLAVLRGHRDWVLGGYFGRHSDQVLTVSRDGTARIWNPDGSYLMTLRGHSSWVTAACFGEHDSCVFTASADHTVRRWLVTESGLVSLMNKHAVRELSAHERAVYLNFEHS